MNNKGIIKSNPHYFGNRSSGGYTLIELLISIGVFVVGIMGALGLSVANYNESQDSVDRIVATNLAREGIELVKNVRDSNWLRIDGNDSCGSDSCVWDSYLTDSANSYVYMDYNSSTPVFLSPSCGSDTTTCVGTYPESRLYASPDKYYYHYSTDNTPTKYYRAMKLNRICIKPEGSISQGDNPATFEEVLDGLGTLCSSHGAGYTQIGLQIVSHVQWNVDGDIQVIEMRDSIYNWRR